MTVSLSDNTTFEWLRTYTALSRSGHVTEAIAECERLWGSEFHGKVEAVDAVRKLPEYAAYVQAIRRALTFPLTLYRVTTSVDFENWRSTNYSRPVATTLSLEFARLMEEVLPTENDLVLVRGGVSDPEAIIMRGRIASYEIVVDSGRVRAIDVNVIGGNS